MHTNNITYTVIHKKIESPEAVTLFLTLGDGSVPAYNPGQFITVFFPEFHTPEGKAYSISSSPYEKCLAMTVKNMGQFSGKLCSLQLGDTFSGSLPYGFFGPEHDDSHLIMLAGGIGVTPFRSMLLSALNKKPNRELTIFYSAKEKENIVFCEELECIAEQYKNTKINFFITQEKINKSTHPHIHSRRMNIDDILPSITANAEFLICGSISFTRNFWKALKNAGVDETIIYTEAFFR